ncbi:MAG: hypothetical protein IH936_12675 [Acidobacteria bacterium]|nr:hypothetical protein [Acidobacteriota bacterium]
MKSSIRKAYCLAAGVVLLLPIGAAAQSIEMTNDDILLKNAGGTTIFLEGNEGKAFFGGGDKYGDIILRDNDGTTTTIRLDGRRGFIQLGSPNESGDLRLWDNFPDNDSSIVLEGDTGNVRQQFGGNGLVKSWAKINGDGTIAACYKCSTRSDQTRRISIGRYEVDFTSIGTSIASRAVLCSNGHVSTTTTSAASSIFCVQRSGDSSSVFVNVENENGTNVDGNFTIVVF